MDNKNSTFNVPPKYMNRILYILNAHCPETPKTNL